MSISNESLTQTQDQLFFNPQLGIEEDYQDVYEKGNIKVGWPQETPRVYNHEARPHTFGVTGVTLGNEGKARVTDLKISKLLEIPGIKLVYVIRYQGGSNTDHTIKEGDNQYTLHQLPSSILYEQAIGILDQGTVVHPLDLRVEIDDIEKRTGDDLRHRVYISGEALLCTDLERVNELLIRVKRDEVKGGAGMGINFSYASYCTQTSNHLHDLIGKNWREVFAKNYDRCDRECKIYGLNLATVFVPDLETSRSTKESTTRPVGSKPEFLDRLERVRTWLIEREMVKNTFLIHRETYHDPSIGVLFEGIHSMGSDAWLGTKPYISSCDASVYGIPKGTGFWRVQDIAGVTGVFVATYTSSTVDRNLPTRATTDRTRWIQENANEKGPVTGKPRIIYDVDLPLMGYHCRMAGVNVLVGTHLDIAGKDDEILVCTHYTKDGLPIYYQPGLKYQEGITPNYIRLPGWDGQQVQRARTVEEQPENALKFLAFIQRRTGYPIVATTTGPERSQFLAFNGFDH